MAASLIDAAHAVPKEMYLCIDPNQTTGEFTLELSHAISGILHADVVAVTLDYRNTTVGQEATQSILYLTFRDTFHPEVVTNIGDSSAIHLPVDTSRANSTNRLYFVDLHTPYSLQRSTSGSGKKVTIRGRLDRAGADLGPTRIDANEYPKLLLRLHFHSENAF